MPYQAGKRGRTAAEPAQVNVAELAVAVGSYLEKHLEDLKDSMNNVAVKVEESAQVLQYIKTRFDEHINAAEKREETVTKELQDLGENINNTLVGMTEQIKASFTEKLNEHNQAQIVASKSSIGTTAEADIVRWYCL
ncbi:unnamed protein product [Allacma fusca]|uniref:Uncharacterized protein n=1 Tax=Allacma fusca TaxID=39272 RepID=A0A8J2KXR1_9HEXA|nr:unnamed protein product [Allacma fusca]